MQPSRYEGNSVTVREAQILCKPVVVTDYSTARNQVKDGVDGVIVPLDNMACAEGIVKVIRSTEQTQALSEMLAKSDYGNVCEAENISLLLR